MVPKLHDPAIKPYISPAWEQHTDLLVHLDQLSQNILLVIAPQEGGKTTFLQHVMAMDTPTIKRFVMTALPDKEQKIFLKMVAEAFDCSWESMESLQEQIATKMEWAREQQETLVLFIDDAHYLTDDQIEILLQLGFLDPATDPLYLVLLGEPSLELRLFSSQWNEYLHRKVYSMELTPWNAEDIRAYWENEPFSSPLSEERCATLLENSEGLPGEVVRQRKDYLSQMKHKKSKMETSSLKNISTHPIALGMIIGSLVGGGYLLFSGVNEAENGTVPSSVAELSEDRWDNETIHLSEATLEKEEPSVAVATVIPLPLPTIAEVKTEIKKEVAPKPKKAPEVKVVEKKKNQQVPVTTKVVYAAPQKLKGSSDRELTEQEKYLLNLKKEHYTLQLLGVREKNNIKLFMNRHGITQQAHSYRTTLSGKDWYVVVYGDYPSKEAAKQAVATMPASLKSKELKPWIREIQTVQKDILQNRA